MKKTLLLSSLLLCFCLQSQAQTKRIKHRSHSGANITFHLDYLDNLGDIRHIWNVEPVTQPASFATDSGILIIDTVQPILPAPQPDTDSLHDTPIENQRPEPLKKYKIPKHQMDIIQPHPNLKPSKPRRVYLAEAEPGPETKVKENHAQATTENGNSSLLILLSVPVILIFFGAMKRMF